MDPLSPSSLRRADVAPQGDDLVQIAPEMERNNEDNIGVKSRDEDGPRIGQGALVGNKWHDLLGPHPALP